MRSAIGWVDFSSEHRDRVRTVIDLLSTPGVVDELGIGIIRDAFSDYMFPGISTIQTRPKYFVIVPRILKDYEALDDKTRKRTLLRDYLAKQELQCRVELVKRYGAREGLGIIGVSFGDRLDRDVQRRPSSVYWNGLRVFKIVRTDQALSEFCRRRSGHRLSLRVLLRETREEMGDDVDADSVSGSPIRELPQQSDWQDRLSISLTAEEAEFLRNQVCASKPESLLGTILLNPKATQEFVQLGETADLSAVLRFPELKTALPRKLASTMWLASEFWRMLYGAHIRYNLLLQERYGTEAGRLSRETEWDVWRDDIASFNWDAWDTDALWQTVYDRGSQVRPWTMRFINGWINACRDGSIAERCDRLVIDQELQNKRQRARLRDFNKDESVRDWIGIRALAYRLPQAWQFVKDIYEAEQGLVEEDAGL